MCRPVSGRLPAIFWVVHLYINILSRTQPSFSLYKEYKTLECYGMFNQNLSQNSLPTSAGAQKHICDLYGSRSRSELCTKSWKEGIKAWFHVVWLKLRDIYCKFYSIKTAQNVLINLRSVWRWSHLFAAELITTEQIIARWLVITN